MTPDMERWAEALAVINLHRDRAQAFVAERLEALKDDSAGRSRWGAIGKRVDQLLEAAAKDERQ